MTEKPIIIDRLLTNNPIPRKLRFNGSSQVFAKKTIRIGVIAQQKSYNLNTTIKYQDLNIFWFSPNFSIASHWQPIHQPDLKAPVREHCSMNCSVTFRQKIMGIGKHFHSFNGSNSKIIMAHTKCCNLTCNISFYKVSSNSLKWSTGPND